ncbi:hypothetical protein RUM43_001043 [Polyplax serrata]|uniref:Uncharacterized protein n=1 Tax=Polyplax serrata TaxID=468196 RepID=A0AAN8XQ06_POLSC
METRLRTQAGTFRVTSPHGRKRKVRENKNRNVPVGRAEKKKSLSGLEVTTSNYILGDGTKQEFTIKLRYHTDKDVSLVNGVRGRRQQETPGGPERPAGGPLRPPPSLTVVLEQEEVSAELEI